MRDLFWDVELEEEEAGVADAGICEMLLLFTGVRAVASTGSMQTSEPCS